MSAKNLDNHNRWRNRQVAFRLSPQEADLLDSFVKISGLTKQDYITQCLLTNSVVVQGNPRVFLAAIKKAPERVKAFIDRILDTEKAEPEQPKKQRESTLVK